MKKIAKLIGICAVAAAMALVFAGCSGDMPYDGLNPADYLKVDNYKGLETEKIKVEVSKQDMGDVISGALKNATENKELKKGTAVAEGDTLNIDYVGRLNGKKFDGGSAEGASLELGSDSFIAGFEDGLVGKKVGEKKIKLNLTFPENYSEKSLAGKDVVFTVTINSATRPEEPKYDDEFAKSMGYNTTEEYEKAVKDGLYKQKKSEAESASKDELWSDVLENTEVKKYPEDELEHYKEVFNEQIDEAVESGSGSREQVLAMYGAGSEKELKKIIKENAELLVKQELLIEYIADKEDLTYSDEEFDKMMKSLTDEEMVEKQTGRTAEQYAHIALLYEKVKDFIYDNAKKVDK